MSDIFDRVRKAESKKELEEKLNQVELKKNEAFAQQANAIINELFLTLKPLESAYDCTVEVLEGFRNRLRIEVPYEFEKHGFFSKERVIKSYVFYIHINDQLYPDSNGFEPEIAFYFYDRIRHRDLTTSKYTYDERFFSDNSSRGQIMTPTSLAEELKDGERTGFKTADEALDYFALVTIHYIAKKGRPNNTNL